MAYQRRVALEVEGDSNFSLEGALGRDSTENTSALAQLALAPLALGTALYRPFLFEARKAMQALNALETTWVLIVTIQVLRRYGLARSVARILASPGLMFCFVFTLILAVGTGLASSNLGALSRYRAPMMPFFAVLLLILRKQTQPALSAPRPSLAGGGSEARVAR